MSRNMNSRNNGNMAMTQQVREPRCPHCSNLNLKRDASSLLPTNHWIRESPDIKSPLVCPVLKGTECRYCYEMGHTVSRCPILEAKKNNSGIVAHQQARNKRADDFFKKEQTSSLFQTGIKKGNKFTALDSDEEEKAKRVVHKKVETVVHKKVEEFPALPSSGSTRGRVAFDIKTKSYSEMAAKPAEPVWPAEPTDDPWTVTVVDLVAPKSITDHVKPKKSRKYSNWADDSSDDEDDLDNFVPDAWDN